MAVRLKPTSNDWLLNEKIFDQAIASLIQQIKIDRTKEVADLAGYSNDGKTFFIDKRMPKGYIYHGRKIYTDKYLLLHELIEKLLLSSYKLPYQWAHQVALRIERDAVIADRVDWNTYNRFMMTWIRYIGNVKAVNPPSDLDLTPYWEENDVKDLKDMGFSTHIPKTKDEIPGKHSQGLGV